MNNMENQNQENKPIKDKIIAAANKGELKMRPKWHFILRAFLWAAGVAILALALLYLSSLILFIARKTGIWVAPFFGWHGVFVFLVSLPWMLVLAVIFFVAALELLVRHYSFAYRLPLLYSALAVLFVVALGGMMVAGTPLHDVLSNCPRPGASPPKKNLPIPGNGPCGTGVYRDLGPRRFENVHKGVVTDVNGQNLKIINRQQEELTVVLDKKTRLPFGMDFSKGDMIVIVGERHGNQIAAFGITRAGD